MIQAKNLPEHLKQILDQEIKTSMLMTTDGALVGSCAEGVNKFDPKVIGALVANTWGEYLHAGKESNPENNLDFLLIELEKGQLAVHSAGRDFLLCVVATKDAASGHMKAKLELLSDFLKDSLDKLSL